jgi:hypothetical protein
MGVGAVHERRRRSLLLVGEYDAVFWGLFLVFFIIFRNKLN